MYTVKRIISRRFFVCLLRLCSAKLWLRLWTLGLMRLSDGTGSCNSLLPQVRSITLFGCMIHDASVDSKRAPVRTFMGQSFVNAHLGPEVLPPHVTSSRFEAGRFKLFVFLVRRVTPPLSAGCTPRASTIKHQSSDFYSMCCTSAAMEVIPYYSPNPNTRVQISFTTSVTVKVKILFATAYSTD